MLGTKGGWKQDRRFGDRGQRDKKDRGQQWFKENNKKIIEDRRGGWKGKVVKKRWMRERRRKKESRDDKKRQLGKREMMCKRGRDIEKTGRKRSERKGGKSIIERWLLQARTPASQDQTWRPQRERPAGTASGGGCQGLASGGSSEGSLQHSRPCPALAAFRPHFLAVVSFSVFLWRTTVSQLLKTYHISNCIICRIQLKGKKFSCPKFGNGTSSGKVFSNHIPSE